MPPPAESMRLSLVLLAVLSLAARWGDAACGCAAHHGWSSAVSHHHHHDHDSPVDPVVDHGCEGECGRAIYATMARVVPPAMTVNLAAVVLDRCGTAAIGDGCEEGLPGGPPLRAMLSVYRI